MEKLNDLNGENVVNYLDMSTVREYESFEAVAFVHDCYLRTSRTGEGFATFVFKDRHANTVVARLFNLENFYQSGFMAESFKKIPVKFTGVCEVYQNSRNIVIDVSKGVEPWHGEFDYDMFVGRVEPELDFYERLCGDAPVKWKTASIDAILNGKVGGYGKLVEVALNCLRGQGKDVYKLFKAVAEEYFKYLSECSSIFREDKGNVTSYLFISKAGEKWKDSELGDYIVMEALSALIGISQPEHLNSHKVVGAFRYARKMLNLESKWESMPEGTMEQFGGDKLFKY